MKTIASGLRLPEGPIAMADGSLLVVEVVGRRLSRIAPDGSISTVATPAGGPNGAAIGADLRTASVTLGSSGRVVTLPWDERGLPLAFSA